MSYFYNPLHYVAVIVYLLIYLQVSGEYAMLHHGAANGAFNLDTTLMEVLTSMRRAGADVIISYFTPRVLEIIQ